LEALRDAYPLALSAHDLEQRTGLPVKTIYACLQELYTNTYIEELDRPRNKRGRPRVRQTQSKETDRYRSRYVIEDMSRGYDHIITAESSMNYPVAPGNVDYPAQFPDVWHKIVETEEENEICTILLRFVEKVQRRINDYSSDEVRKWAPTTKIDFCCSQCGINHEARDFIRATLLHLIDHLERNSKFIEFMKKNDFINTEVYQNMIKSKEGIFKEDRR